MRLGVLLFSCSLWCELWNSFVLRPCNIIKNLLVLRKHMNYSVVAGHVSKSGAVVKHTLQICAMQLALRFQAKHPIDAVAYMWHCWMNVISRRRITNRQKLLTFYCLWPFILTLRPGLIMPQTSDDSLLASRSFEFGQKT